MTPTSLPLPRAALAAFVAGACNSLSLEGDWSGVCTVIDETDDGPVDADIALDLTISDHEKEELVGTGVITFERGDSYDGLVKGTDEDGVEILFVDKGVSWTWDEFGVEYRNYNNSRTDWLHLDGARSEDTIEGACDYHHAERTWKGDFQIQRVEP